MKNSAFFLYLFMGWSGSLYLASHSSKDWTCFRNSDASWLVYLIRSGSASSTPRKSPDFQYDLASLYPTSFGTAIYRHCLLLCYKKQLLVKLEAVFLKHQTDNHSTQINH